MQMPLVRAGGHSHRIIRYGTDDYRLVWFYDVKYKGSRLRFERKVQRDTDRKGAERFAKKWGVPMPKDP